MRVLLTVTGGPLPQPTPAQYAGAVADLAGQLKGRNVAYEVWNEPDEKDFWLNGPQPAEYAALLKAAYPAIKSADPAAVVLVGGLVGNDFEFVERLYDNGAKGSFDGVGVHTDTACLTTDPREYYREPSGRIGRYSFTGYREVRATMLAHGDDKPVWMTELGWASTTAICERGGRAGTKAGGVTQAEQADFLAKAYGCLANDPWVEQAAWFNLHDLQTGSTNDSLNLGLITDAFVRKPAFAAFQRAAGAAPIACGGTMDAGVPQVTIESPTDGQLYLTSLPISRQGDRRPGRHRHRPARRRQGGPAQDGQERHRRLGEVRVGRREEARLRPAHDRRDRLRRGQERRPRDDEGHARRRRQVPLQGPDRATR